MTSEADARLDRLCLALGDATRRRILERLRSEPGATTGRLADDNASLSRWAVTKHLAVLREAGLVRTMPDGRRRRHWVRSGALDEIREWLERGAADAR